MPTIDERRETFRALHQAGCFVMPNPWDVGTARYLQHLGFPALATTSVGFAFAQGRPDGGVPRELMLAHIRELVEATDVPVSADFENGHADDPAGVAESVRLCVETGVAGLSIEDSTGDRANPLYDIDTAVQRMQAARKAIDEAGANVVLTGRAENFFVGKPDLEDTITRLRAYADAGADCVYAHGMRSPDDIAAVVKAVAPTPVNAIVGWNTDRTVSDYAKLGVRRISIGGGLAFTAWQGVMQAASRLAEAGSFDGMPTTRPAIDLTTLFRGDIEHRNQ